jgi:hypothetical protein
MNGRAVLDAAASEAELLALVREAAGRFGWRSYHTHDSRRSEAGFPDLVLARGGELIFAELKSERGRVSETQRAWLADLEAAGCEVHVWRPSDGGALLDRLRSANT